MTRMLTFRENLYLGEGISAKKIDRIKKRLRENPLFANVYLLTFAGNPADQLEFFDSKLLIQPYYKDKSFEVLGLAKDYDDALGLVNQITEDCLCARGDCNLREYLSCLQ